MKFNSVEQVKKYLKEKDLDFNDFKYATDSYFDEDGAEYNRFFEAAYPIELVDFDKNEQILKDIEKSTIDDLVDYEIKKNKDKFQNEYSAWIQNEANVNEKFTFSDDCLKEIVKGYIHDSAFTNGFKQEKKKYYDYFEAEIGNDDYKYVDEEKTDKTYQSASALDEADDSIGDTHKIDFGFDVQDRDYAFIYLDGDIIKGKLNQTHAQILKDYLKNNDKEDLIPEDLKDGGDVGDSRPSMKRMQRLTGEENVAFGNVIGKVAFIEVVNGIDENEVAKECMNQLNIDKVYFASHANEMVKRLAKWAVASNIKFSNINDLKDYLGADYKTFLNAPACIHKDGIIQVFDMLFPTSKRNKDRSLNDNAYQGVNEFEQGQYIQGIFKNNMLLNQYNAWLKKYNSSDNLSIDEDCLDEVTDDMVENTNFENEFEGAKKTFIVDHEQGYPGFGENGYKGINEDKDNEVEKFKDVPTLDDKVGDITYVTKDYELDVGTRDGAFLYIDGQILKGGKNETHAQLLQKYMEEEGKKDEIPEDLVQNNQENSRPSEIRMKRLTETEDVAFGSLLKNIAFIEVFENGADENTVAQACMKELGVKKVYFLDDKNVLKRLAKWNCY